MFRIKIILRGPFKSHGTKLNKIGHQSQLLKIIQIRFPILLTELSFCWMYTVYVFKKKIVARSFSLPFTMKRLRLHEVQNLCLRQSVNRSAWSVQFVSGCHCLTCSMGLEMAEFQCCNARPRANMYDPSTNLPKRRSGKNLI